MFSCWKKYCFGKKWPGHSVALSWRCKRIFSLGIQNLYIKYFVSMMRCWICFLEGGCLSKLPTRAIANSPLVIDVHLDVLRNVYMASSHLFFPPKANINLPIVGS